MKRWVFQKSSQAKSSADSDRRKRGDCACCAATRRRRLSCSTNDAVHSKVIWRKIMISGPPFQSCYHPDRKFSHG